MRLNIFLSLLVAGTLASIASTAKADNIVLNPTFDNAPGAYPGYNTIVDWTSPDTFVYSGDPGATGSGAAAGTPFDTPGLPAGATNAAFIQVYTGGGGPNSNDLTQTLATVAGQTYDISYMVNARNCCGGDTNLTATVGSDYTYSAVVNSGDWVLVTGQFTASSNSEVLEFQNTLTNGADATLLVTDVSVSGVAATPEPSSLALLGTGLVGAAGMIRRKFKK